MPRSPRLDIPGLTYHVIFRGIERREIFKDDKDYSAFLDRLQKLSGEEAIKVYAFALMPNHVHLLIRPLRASMSTFMRRLLTGYAIYFNKRHKRSGHLFQNRYKSFVVEESLYFLELVRYIHLNPVRAGIVTDIDQLSAYPYTGYSALMGRINYPFLDADEVLLHFSPKTKTARKSLTEFMQDGLALGRQNHLTGGGLKKSLAILKPEDKRERQIYDERILGSGFFVESILKEVENKLESQPETLLDDFLEKVAGRYNITVAELCSSSKRALIAKARAETILLGVREFGISVQILSKALHICTPTVYSIIRRDEQRDRNKGLSMKQ